MDDFYARRMIQGEQSELHQRAMFAQLDAARPGRTANDPPRAENRVPNAGSGTGLYRPLAPSNATPMERFLTPSPADDPSGFLFRRQMQDAGIAYGSYESLQRRMMLPIRWTQEKEAESQEKSSSMEAQASESGHNGQEAAVQADARGRSGQVNPGTTRSG